MKLDGGGGGDSSFDEDDIPIPPSPLLSPGCVPPASSSSPCAPCSSFSEDRGAANVAREVLKRKFGLSRQQSSRANLQQALDRRLLAAKYDYKEMELPVDSRATFALAFSPDGTMVASTHGDHKIYVSQVDSGKVLYVLEGHPRTPWCVAWHPHPNTRLLASGCLGGVTIVWQLGDPVVKEVWRPEREEALAHKLVSSVAFHPRRRELLVAMANCLLFWDWNRSAPHRLVTTGNPAERISVVMFDPLSRCLFTAISNVYTPTLSEVLQSSFNPNESPSFGTNSSLRPITIDIINTGQLGPRCQSTASGFNRHSTSTQTDSSTFRSQHQESESTSNPEAPQTSRSEEPRNIETPSTSKGSHQGVAASQRSSSPPKTGQRRYNLRQTSARSASDAAAANSKDEDKPGQNGSAVKRKSTVPVKSSVRSTSSSAGSRKSPKRRKIAQKTVGTNTDDLQNMASGSGSSGNELGPPSAIRANVYFSEFPASYYSSAIQNRTPVFPLFNSDPHGAIFHSHFPRNFVRLETEPLHADSSCGSNATSSSGAASSSSSWGPTNLRSSASGSDDTLPGQQQQQPSNNPEDYLRIAVVYCAANPSTSMISTSSNHQATVPMGGPSGADSGYRVSVRLHPPIDRNISIQSGAFGVRVSSERRSENDIDPPSRELSATDLFANRLIETLRSTLRSSQQRVNRRLLRTNFREQLVARGDTTTTTTQRESTPPHSSNQQRVTSLRMPNPPSPNLNESSMSSPPFANQPPQSSSQNVTGIAANESASGLSESSFGSEDGASNGAGTSRVSSNRGGPVFVSSHHRIVLGRIVSVGGPAPGSSNPSSGGPERGARVGVPGFSGAETSSGPSSGPGASGYGFVSEPSISRLGGDIGMTQPPGPPPTTAQDYYRDIGVELNPPPSAVTSGSGGGGTVSYRRERDSSPNRIARGATFTRNRFDREFTRIPRRTAADTGPPPPVQSTRDVNGTHHLYDISVFDSRLRPNEAIQDAITRVVFGAFAATGDYRRAQQRTSFRLQYWDMDDTPVIYNSEMNVIESRCKLLNQTAVDISKDGTLLGLLTAHDGYDFEETFVTLYALDKIVSRPKPVAQIPVGHNAISVSISPSKQFVFLAYFDKTSAQSFFPTFLMGPSLGEIFEYKPNATRVSERLVPVKELNQMTKQQPPNQEQPSRGSNDQSSNSGNSGNVNCAAWLPTPGKGLMYGTTLGELVVCSAHRPKLGRKGTSHSAETEQDNDEEGTSAAALFDPNSPSDILLRLGRHNFQLEEENMNAASGGDLYL